MTDRPTAIVTGAGSGVGRQTTLMLARLGYNVVLVGRREHKLEETVSLAGTTEGDLAPLAYDISDASAARAAVAETVRAFERLDALINNAGVARKTPIDKITPELCRNLIDTNFTGVVNAVAAAWPTFRKQHGGIVVNVSALATLDPPPLLSVYTAAKAAVNAFTRSVAAEGAPIGVKAVAVAPAPIETAMFRRMFTERQFPPARTLDPADVAEVIRDCVTGDRAFASGDLIQVAKQRAGASR